MDWRRRRRKRRKRKRGRRTEYICCKRFMHSSGEFWCLRMCVQEVLVRCFATYMPPVFKWGICESVSRGISLLWYCCGA
jgi:hypothetical protein